MNEADDDDALWAMQQKIARKLHQEHNAEINAAPIDQRQAVTRMLLDRLVWQYTDLMVKTRPRGVVAETWAARWNNGELSHTVKDS